MIREGLKLFNIPEKDVKEIVKIDINLTHASTFITEMKDMRAPERGGRSLHPLAALIGDAAMQVC